MKKIIISYFFVLLAMTINTAPSFALSSRADIYGSVVLRDGNRIPGVLITLTGDMIGRLTTISSEKGNFRFQMISPGTYELKCQLEGFKTVIQKNIEIRSEKSVILKILMETTNPYDVTFIYDNLEKGYSEILARVLSHYFSHLLAIRSIIIS
jgi:hypothetical protein